MKYFVTLRARTYEIDVGGGRVTVDGEPFEAHLAAVPGTPLYHLLLAGHSWTVDAVDDRTRQIQALTGRGKAPSGGGVVKAPMPGLVVRVEVEVGQHVDTGAGLVVVEAMKMENELRATRPGVVQTIHVAPGQTVDKGASLVTLGPLQNVEPSG